MRRILNSLDLRNRLTSPGYTAPVHNMYHVLGEDDDDDSTTKITVTTIVAAATATGGTWGSGTMAGSIHPGLIAAINQSIAPTFNQVVQNQSVLQNQVAAISMAQPPPVQSPPPQFLILPVPQVTFPMHQPFVPSFQTQQFQPAARRGMQGQYGYGHGNQGGRGGCGNQGGSRGGRQWHPSFAS
jgi:hypothetical protein